MTPQAASTRGMPVDSHTATSAVYSTVRTSVRTIACQVHTRACGGHSGWHIRRGSHLPRSKGPYYSGPGTGRLSQLPVTPLVQATVTGSLSGAQARPLREAQVALQVHIITNFKFKSATVHTAHHKPKAAAAAPLSTGPGPPPADIRLARPGAIMISRRLAAACLTEGPPRPGPGLA